MSKTITAQAPATIANVGPGFDVMGFAFEGPAATVRISPADHPGITVSTDNPKLPCDPQRNTATVAIQALCDLKRIEPSIAVHIEAGIPIGSGMGSSAASAVAGAVAANSYFDTKLSTEELIPFALAGEAVASDCIHADNVAPGLFGGIGIVRQHDPVDWVPIAAPAQLHCAVVYPNVQVKTADARQVLPASISLQQASHQWAQLASVVAALANEDFELLGRALRDELIEPLRCTLIPGYADVKAAAKFAGALACVIAGSGPSLCAFTNDAERAPAIQQAMQSAFGGVGIKSQGWCGAIRAQGARVM